MEKQNKMYCLKLNEVVNNFDINLVNKKVAYLHKISKSLNKKMELFYKNNFNLMVEICNEDKSFADFDNYEKWMVKFDNGN